MPLPFSDYFLGALLLAVTTAACTLAAALIVRRRAAELRGSERALALFLVATGALAAAHLVPGILGILGRGSVLACAALVLAVALRVPVAAGAPALPDHPAGGGDPPWSRALAAAGVFAAAAAATIFLLARSTEPVTAVDAMTTHLPVVARWIQEGSVWPIVQYAPDLANGAYPENGTLMMLAAVLPWHSTFAVRYVDVPFLIAFAFAIFACARELRAPATAAALAGAAVTALAAVNEPALRQAQLDAPMLAWMAIGALFALRAQRSGRRRDLVLAAAGLGLAFGTKWYAVAYVPLLAIVAAALALSGGRRPRALLAPAAGLAAIVAATGGFWLLRNWVQIGNPVHPAAVKLLGITVFDAPVDTLRERAGFSVADYLLDGAVWRDYFVPAYRDNFGLLGPLLIAAIATATVVALRRRGGDPRVLAVAAASAAMALAYTLLPDTAFGLPGAPRLVGANARYLVPALAGGAVLAAWLAGRGGRWRALAELALLAGIVDGVLRSYDGVGVRHVVAGVLLVLAAGVALRRSAPALQRLAPSAGTLAAAVALLVLGGSWVARHRLGEARYGLTEAPIAWLEQRLPVGASVGLASVWSAGSTSPVLPAFGPRLHNRVVYLGRFVGGTLRSWTEPGPFAAQVRRERLDAIVIGTGVPKGSGAEEPSAAWAAGLGYRRVETSERLVLMVREGLTPR